MIEPRGQSRTVRRASRGRGRRHLRRVGGGPSRPELLRDGRGDPTGRSARRDRPDGGPGGGRVDRSDARERAIESQKREKPPRGATPGGLRIRLLMKETVRGPLGGSLLLCIHVALRIAGARERRKQRGCGHAAAGLAGETAEDLGSVTPMAELRPERAERQARKTRLTRLRLRFRRVVLGESYGDHGTLPHPLGLRPPHVGFGLVGRRSGQERDSTSSARFDAAQDFNSRRPSNQGLARNDIKRD